MLPRRAGGERDARRQWCRRVSGLERLVAKSRRARAVEEARARVGERGPELFTPNTAGSVTPNHQLASGSTNISFNITTVDADGFEDMLQEQRGTIISMINSALNEQGRPAIV